ncbi:MAG: filamentous hemagglutinin N-terminal domain-containing protein [Proteobacteria bacterium]|nr:filamentous hemagglutinin N-terminal domain-containing protein [Pseudomonadota bacterium]
MQFVYKNKGPIIKHVLKAARTATLSLLTGVVLACLNTPPTWALPQNGQIVGGAGSIQNTGTELTVQQNTDRLAIDWDSFNIANGEAVRFQQPSAASIAVNRVANNQASLIDGLLQANGNLVIINRSGMVFGPHAVVDAAGLIATTSNLDTAAFMAGGPLNFHTPGLPDAKIVNNGTLTVQDAGLVGLVAPTVENNGVIQARLGKVALASGDVYTIDMAGDGLLDIALSDDVTAQKITQTGTVTAAGGTINVTAASGRNVVDSLLQLDGAMTVSAADRQAGTIRIQASGGGQTAQIGGELHADSTNADGGIIRIRADGIHILQASKISANATTSGNGGEVIVYADGNTVLDGEIEAKGGSQSGDGGFVEVSGARHLVFNGRVNTDAPAGTDGSVLLDPGEIVVCQFGASANAACNPAGAPELTGPTYDSGANAVSYVNIGASGTAGSLLDTLINSSNVTVRSNTAGAGSGDITITDAIDTTGVNRTLTFQARGQLIVNAPIQARTLVLEALGDIVINAALTNTGGTGNLTLRPLSNATTVGVAGGAGTFDLSTADLANITTGWTNLIIGRTTATAAMNINAYSWNVPVQFVTQTGALNIDGTQTMNGNNLLLQTRNLNINAAITSNGSGNLTIQSDNNAITTGFGDAAGGTLNLTNAELDFIDGQNWANLLLGRTSSTADTLLDARTWQQNVQLRSGTGVLTINGNQTMANGADLLLATRALSLGADLIGTGTLTFRPDATNRTLGVGDGAAGDLQISNADIAHIQQGWSSVAFGHTGSTVAQTVAAQTWSHNVVFQADTGSISFDGIQNLGNHNMTVNNRGTVDFNAAINGTGTLEISPIASNRTLGLAGAAGNQNVTAASLDNLAATWSQLLFGRTDSTATLSVAAYSNWRSPVTFRSNTGAITISGAQDFGTQNVIFETAGNPAINANMAGTGTLTFKPLNQNTTFGLAGASGTINLTAAEMNRLVGPWAGIVFGRSDGTGLIRINAYSNWSAPITFLNDTGQVRVDGAQDFGAHDVTIQTNSTPVWNATLAGTGIFTYQQGDIGTQMGMGGAAGPINLSDALLNRLSDGWSELRFGRTDSTTALDIDAYTGWKDPVTFRAGGGINLNGAQIAQAATNGGYTFSSAATLNADLTTDGGNIRFDAPLTLATGARTLTSAGGTVTFANTANGTQDLIVNAGAGTVAVQGIIGGVTPISSFAVTAGLTQLTGTVTSVGTQNYNSPVALTGNTTLKTTDADISLNNTVNGAHTLIAQAGTGTFTTGGIVGGTTPLGALTVTADNVAIGAATTVTGNIALQSATAGRTIGLGDAGGLNLSAAELANLHATLVQIGAATAGNLTFGTVTLPSALLVQTGGTTTFNGVVTANATGDALVVVSGGNVVNNGGTSALSSPNGRHLVYSADPAQNTLNGLTGFLPLYNASYSGTPPSSVTGTDDRFVYTFAPTLTVSVAPSTRIEGETNPTFRATFEGLQGVDTLAQAVTGEPKFITAANDGSIPGTYSVLPATGGLSSPLGYRFNFVAGKLKVTFGPKSVPGNVRALTQLATWAYRPQSPIPGGGNIGKGGSDLAENVRYSDRLETLLLERSPRKRRKVN